MRLLGLLVLLSLPQEPDRHQTPPPVDRRWEKMDYGPFLTTAVSMTWPPGAVTPKGIVPGEEEIALNPRARSARLRVAERLAA